MSNILTFPMIISANILKIGTPRVITAIVLKWNNLAFQRKFATERSDGMANSVDPNKTAPLGAV